MEKHEQPKQEKVRWQMEYYCPYPNIRINFIVMATDGDEALSIGNDAIRRLRMTGCYKARRIEQ